MSTLPCSQTREDDTDYDFRASQRKDAIDFVTLCAKFTVIEAMRRGQEGKSVFSV